MNCIAIIADIATAFGTLTLAYFTCQSVRQSKNMAEVARQSIDMTKKIEKSKIKPYCTINPIPERLGETTYGTCPKAYFWGDNQTVPKLSCIIKNHGPGAAHAVTIMLGGTNKTLWTKRISVADILAPGVYVEFEREISKDDLPSSEEREYPRTQSKGRVEGQPEYLCSNIQYAALEYTDSETTKFHAIRLFVPRNALRGLQVDEPSDSQKFAATEVEMQFFDGPHENNPYYGETEEIKAQRLGHAGVPVPHVN